MFSFCCLDFSILLLHTPPGTPLAILFNQPAYPDSASKYFTCVPFSPTQHMILIGYCQCYLASEQTKTTPISVFTAVTTCTCNFILNIYLLHLVAKCHCELPCIQFKVLNIMNRFPPRHQLKRPSRVLLISILAGPSLNYTDSQIKQILGHLNCAPKGWVKFLLLASKQQAEEVTLLAAYFTYTSTLKKA